MKRILMHKDIRVADLFFQNGKIIGIDKIYDMEHLPAGCHAAHESLYVPLLQSWQKMRAIPHYRESSKDLEQKLGFPLLEGAFRSNGLSLTDCYWYADPGNILSWDEINYHKVGFPADGLGIFGGTALPSPDFTTDGFMKKIWVNLSGIPTLIKSSERNPSVMCANEVIAYRISICAGISHVPYYPIRVNSELVCGTPCFIEDDSLEFVSALAHKHDYMQIKLYDEFTRIGMEDFIQAMVAFDMLIGNTDRHTRNFGYFRDPDTLKIIGPAPLFDSGMCLQRIATGCQTVKPFAQTREEGLKLLKGMPIHIPEQDTLISIIRSVYEEFGLQGHIEDSVTEILKNREELINHVSKLYA